MSKEKKLVPKDIFRKMSTERPFLWKDIKHLEFEDNDAIKIGWEEAYYGSDSAMDAHFYVCVTRMILETDEEFEKRLEDDERQSKWSKERRYKNYLSLKKEFEDE